jgi:hypothetical protein
MDVDITSKRLGLGLLVATCIFSCSARAADDPGTDRTLRSECAPLAERQLEPMALAFYLYVDEMERAKVSGEPVPKAYLIQWPTDNKMEVFRYRGASLRPAFESASELMTLMDTKAVGYVLVWRDRMLTYRNETTRSRSDTKHVVRMNLGFPEGSAYEAYFPLKTTTPVFDLVEVGCGFNLLSLRKNIANASHSAKSGGEDSDSVNWKLMHFRGQAADEAATP